MKSPPNSNVIRCWQEEEPEIAGEFTQANKEELNKREIKKARRRGVTSQDGEGKSVFAGFGGFGGAAAKPAGQASFY